LFADFRAGAENAMQPPRQIQVEIDPIFGRHAADSLFGASKLYWRRYSRTLMVFRRLRASFLLSLPPRHRAFRLSARLASIEGTIMAQIGTVKFFNADKGFGFIAPDKGGADAFVHISAVERAGFVTLQQNQRVSYELENDRRGRTSAVSLEAAE
jgi:CspA family cold shock protein